MSTDEALDPTQVEQAQRQIRRLVEQTAQLSRQNLAPDEFFARFLDHAVAALAAPAGAVWLRDADAAFELVGQQNIAETGLVPSDEASDGHQALLQKAITSSRGMLVPPRYRDENSAAENPTELLLVLAPIQLSGGAGAVIEIFQRPDSLPRTQRGYLRFLLQMSEIAATYLRQRQQSDSHQRQAMWQRLEQFVDAVHASLDPQQTAYAIANEGRQLIDCDRVTVVVNRHGHCQVEAISGQDVFDHRALAIRRLGALAEGVIAGRESIWYRGVEVELPPQIENLMQDYLDASHARQVAIVPIVRGEESCHANWVTPVGAIVVEQLGDAAIEPGQDERVATVAKHAGAALGNALEHGQLFLMPLWRAIGNSRAIGWLRSLPRATAIATMVAGIVAALVVIPFPLRVQSPGALQPVVRRDVFAPLDGTVDEIRIRHGQQVAAGELLVTLRNTDLDVAFADLLGEREATTAQLQAIESERYLVEKSRSASVEERNRLEGRRSELKQRLISLDKQLELSTRKRETLQVKAPVAGTVTSWNVEQLLRQRPVRQGQALLGVADVKGDWELELRVPEHRMGNLVDAEARQLPVTFRLATSPGVDHYGTITEVQRSAEVRGDDGNTVLVRVKIDRQALGDLRPGSDVTARIDCGWRPLGYVLFQDLIAFVQSHVLFKL
ncbi:MAG: HlyD family efflux transporter periplasmic adaptor subunit [Planctomycetes bacterium]|nr:HlyD family efflux transporter periplasmic adaptor subunit [Planctomycetota bacterium]